MKPKVALVPKWESPQIRAKHLELKRIQWSLEHGKIRDRNEREQVEGQIKELKREIGP